MSINKCASKENQVGIIIIGGGVAGMMAAISASKNHNSKVIILEKNEKLGKKLFITGKGRCNITNDIQPQEFVKNLPNNPKFVLSAIYALSPRQTMEYFEELGLPLKTERGGRVFPVSDKSSDVIDALYKQIKFLGIEVCLNEEVKYFELNENSITSVVTQRAEYFPIAVIIATGGQSYPGTGSTGDGYKFAKMLGHSVVPPRPALCPIILKGGKGASGNLFPREKLPFPEGLSLKNVSIKCRDNNSNKIIHQDFGEMLFTRKGVSGPLILTLSSLINKRNPVELSIEIDLKPALDFNTLDARVLRDFKENLNKQFKNCLDKLLPQSLIPYIIALSGINPEIKVNSITKEERTNFVKLLKSLTFPLESLGSIAESIVTAGGVSTKEIDPRTMKSKIIDNLYFAGEVLDVDGITGGFNIQIAISTGNLAGKMLGLKK